MPEEFDMSIYDGCKCISQYDEFEESFLSTSSEFPINEEALLYNYYFDDTPVYIKICDLLEEVYKNDSYHLDSEHHYPKTGLKLMKTKIRFWVERMLGRMYSAPVFGSVIKSSKKLSNIGSLRDHSLQMEKKNYSTDKEINEIENRISQSLKPVIIEEKK